MTTHYLDDEGSLVAGGGGGEVVNGIDDAVQSRVRADGHVGSNEIVVDGTDESRDHEGGVLAGHLGAHPTRVDKFGDEIGPLGAQHVQTSERTIATNDDETIDSVLQEVLNGLQPT